MSTRILMGVNPDPCNCEHRCEHGDLCIGGHADFPNSHWYHCETCSPPTAIGYNVTGGTLIVVQACRHAIGPGALTVVSRTATEHARTCEADAAGWVSTLAIHDDPELHAILTDETTIGDFGPVPVPD